MPATQWTIDAMHSDVLFKVKHLMITTVTGRFTSFSATMLSDSADFSDAEINFTAETGSISTGLEQRDNHLKSDDFFNADKFPTLSFTSTNITPSGNGEFELTGMMTIRDTTKEITLKGEFGGIQQDFYGNTKAGFELTGKINRKEFGLMWDAVTEAGGIVVSDEVRLALNVQMQKVA